MMPEVREGDFDVIRQRLDFYGLNFYNGIYDNAGPKEFQAKKVKAGGNFQDKPQSHPEAVYQVLHMLVEKYGVDIPIYMTENGLAQEDSKNLEELLEDEERIAYLRQILIWLYKAMEDGIPVKGYYVWSLLDNFEWSAGYTLRYGLYYTDYKTKQRIPKKSAEWYREVIRQHGV